MGSSTSKRFLVTAGNTREKIDAVRDWGNIFTGNTGFSIAKALAGEGEVDLLTSNRAHLAEAAAGLGTAHRIRATAFTSHPELKGALSVLMERENYSAIFMTAAVADYRPERVYEVVERRPDPGGTEFAPGRTGQEIWVVRDVQAAKVRSTHPSIAVLGKRTEKLVDLFRTAWSYTGLLVKFKLEVAVDRDALLRIGEESRRASGANFLVANSLEMVDGPGAGAYLLSDQGIEWVARGDLAARLLRLVLENEAGRASP